MKFESLIAEFGSCYGIGDLVPDEDGVVTIRVDDRFVTFMRQGETDFVIVMAELRAASEAGEDAVNRLLMQANQTLFVEDGLVIVRPGESDRYCLLDRFCVTDMDFHDFDRQVGRLLSRADSWGLFLERYVPVAAEAAATGGGSSAPSGIVAHGDMLRV